MYTDQELWTYNIFFLFLHLDIFILTKHNDVLFRRWIRSFYDRRESRGGLCTFQCRRRSRLHGLPRHRNRNLLREMAAHGAVSSRRLQRSRRRRCRRRFAHHSRHLLQVHSSPRNNEALFSVSHLYWCYYHR